MSSQTWRGKREAEMAMTRMGMIEGFEKMGIGSGGTADLAYGRESLYNRNIEENTKKKTVKKETGNKYFNPEPEHAKVLQVDRKSDFERELNKYLSKGWIVSPGESLKIYNQVYTILLVKKTKTYI